MECFWYMLLVEDVRRLIRTELDQVSLAMLGQTCQREWAHFVSQKDPFAFNRVPMVSMCARLGHLELYDTLEALYGCQESFRYALGGDARAYPFIESRLVVLTLFMDDILSMSWTIYTRLLAEGKLVLTDGDCFEYLHHNLPAFRDKQVVCDMLKRCANVGFSERCFQLAVSDGTLELCDYIFAKDRFYIWMNIAHDKFYSRVRDSIDAGNAETFAFLQKKSPVPMAALLSGSGGWQNLGDLAIHRVCAEFRRFPTYARDIVPMVKLLRALDCPWLDSNLSNLVRVMAKRKCWDKRQLLQLRDLGMPMILTGIDQTEREKNPYMKWVVECLIPGME